MKDIENRTWRADFRGRIYVHASQRPDRWGKGSGLVLKVYMDKARYSLDMYDQMDIRQRWLGKSPAEEFGAIIGEVDIVDCVTQSDSPWFEGPYGLVLANPVAYQTPIPYKGRQGLFEVTLTPDQLANGARAREREQNG